MDKLSRWDLHNGHLSSLGARVGSRSNEVLFASERILGASVEDRAGLLPKISHAILRRT